MRETRKNDQIFIEKVGLSIDGLDCKESSRKKQVINKGTKKWESHGFRPHKLNIFLNSFVACRRQGLWPR